LRFLRKDGQAPGSAKSSIEISEAALVEVGGVRRSATNPLV